MIGQLKCVSALLLIVLVGACLKQQPPTHVTSTASTGEQVQSMPVPAELLAPIVVTPADAREHPGRAAMVEATVVEVKFAERRQIYFLSARPNFRSAENFAVAIRAADFEPFRQAGIRDLDELKARYQGQAIRARGTVWADEGQDLLLVAAPAEIVVRGEPAAAVAASELVVINEHGQRTVIGLPLSPELTRSEVQTEKDGVAEKYAGVLLATILERADVTLGNQARGPMVARYILVSAHDGYAAVLSIAEIDPFYAEQPVLLADRLNGAPLPAAKGPLQIVIPADKHRRRWIGQVTRIEVRNALDKPTAP